MTLSKEIVEILICPKCQNAVTYHEADNKMICTPCQLAYPVQDDIPVMLLDEAKPISS